MGPSRTVFDIMRDIYKIFPSRTFNAPRRGYTKNFVTAAGLRLLECQQKCDDVCIRFDTMPALDRQTNGRTDGQTDRIGKTISLSACIGVLTRDNELVITLS